MRITIRVSVRPRVRSRVHVAYRGHRTRDEGLKPLRPYGGHVDAQYAPWSMDDHRV